MTLFGVSVSLVEICFGIAAALNYAEWQMVMVRKCAWISVVCRFAEEVVADGVGDPPVVARHTQHKIKVIPE